MFHVIRDYATKSHTRRWLLICAIKLARVWSSSRPPRWTERARSGRAFTCSAFSTAGSVSSPRSLSATRRTWGALCTCRMGTGLRGRVGGTHASRRTGRRCSTSSTTWRSTSVGARGWCSASRQSARYSSSCCFTPSSDPPTRYPHSVCCNALLAQVIIS